MNNFKHDKETQTEYRFYILNNGEIVLKAYFFNHDQYDQFLEKYQITHMKKELIYPSGAVGGHTIYMIMKFPADSYELVRLKLLMD